MGQLELDEPVQVLVDFRPARLGGVNPAVVDRRAHAIPRAFIWRNRRYLIDSLNLVHKEKQGEATIYYFSVSTETDTYKLAFNNSMLEWRLVEIWHE